MVDSKPLPVPSVRLHPVPSVRRIPIQTETKLQSGDPADSRPKPVPSVRQIPAESERIVQGDPDQQFIVPEEKDQPRVSEDQNKRRDDSDSEFESEFGEEEFFNEKLLVIFEGNYLNLLIRVFKYDRKIKLGRII